MPANRRFYAKRVGVLLGVWCVLTGLLVLTGIGVVHSSTVVAFDRHITSTVVRQRTDALDQTMKVVTWLGSWVALVAAAAVLLILAVGNRLRWPVVAIAVIAWVGEEGAVTLAKHAVGRPRPPREIWVQPAHGWSWPSGHTATAALAFSVLALVAAGTTRSRMTRTAAWTAGAVTVAAVGFSRVELGVHWTTDVIASFAFVSSWVLVVVLLFAAELRGGTIPRSSARDLPVTAPPVRE